MSGNIDKKGVENLANAIVRQAVHDYRRAARILKRCPNHEGARVTKEEIEAFFRSPWFTILTSVNGCWLMGQLQKEVA